MHSFTTGFDHLILIHLTCNANENLSIRHLFSLPESLLRFTPCSNNDP